MTINIISEKLDFVGPAGRLEALLDRPAGEQLPEIAAVICHPHPLYQGAMTNKVVYMLARTLAQQGIPALRFNFRGVGESAGKYANGEGETEDTLAACDWVGQNWPHARLWLGGFSFGSYTALKASSRRDVAALITIAPPVERFDVKTLSLPMCPWLLVQGEADEVVSAKAVLQWARGLENPPIIIPVPDVGHYFHGELNTLKKILLDALAALRGDITA